MKYLLFAYHSHDASGVDLDAMSNDLQKLIDRGQSLPSKNNGRDFNVEIFEVIPGTGLVLRWSNNGTPPGDFIKVEWL